MLRKTDYLLMGGGGGDGGGAKSYDLYKSFNALWPYSSTHTRVMEEKYTNLIISL
jgi:hypothetical protein